MEHTAGIEKRLASDSDDVHGLDTPDALPWRLALSGHAWSLLQDAEVPLTKTGDVRGFNGFEWIKYLWLMTANDC